MFDRCFPRGAPGRPTGRVTVTRRLIVVSLFPLVVGLAAASVFPGAAAAAEPRVFLITAADKGNFPAGSVRDKIHADENSMQAIFHDLVKEKGVVEYVHVPNDDGPIKIEDVRSTLDKVAAMVVPEKDAVVFYFSGHGYFDPKVRTFNLVVAEKQEAKGLPRTEVRNQLLAMKPRLAVLLTDCCAAEQRLSLVRCIDSLPVSVATRSPLFRSLFLETSGIVDITSSTPPQLSWVSGEYKNSVFTWALVKTLDERKQDGNATWRDVFDAARDVTVKQSIQESEKFGGDRKQVPLLVRYEGTYRGRNFEKVRIDDGEGLPQDNPPVQRREPFGLTMRLLDNGSAIVTGVKPGSPVDRAGIEADDVIVRWGAVGPFENLQHLDRVVDEGGGDVVLTIRNHRDGQLYETRVNANPRD